MSAEKMAERATAYIAQQRAQFTDGLSAIHTAHLRLQAALDVAIKERDEARAEVERLSKAHEAACGGEELLRAAFTRLLDRLTRERDEARAEVARLLLESEVLAKHEGSPGREWHSAGAWLLPGDTINVVRAPLEAKP